MNEHEEKTIDAFILKERRDRYKFLLGSDDHKRRSQCTNRLNHWRDFDPKYATWLPSNANVVALLRREGSPESVYVISNTDSIDKKVMPLVDAVSEAESNGWGTIISCIPGRLAYYYDEEGESRAILKR